MSQTAISIRQQKYDAGAVRVDMKLEVQLIPVSDVDRAKEFYTRLGWRLDDDMAMGNDDFCISKRSGKRHAARGSRTRRARESHRTARRELAGLVRSVHGGGASRD